jgi:multidrug efflux pump subunit AcrA (membrane-fusion protein)
LIAALLTSSCAKKEAAETEQPAPVQVTAVTQAAIHNVVGGDGILFPNDQASVMPKISAPVQKFYVNRGDHVKKGQLLAELENRDLTAQAAESKGALEQAESNLRTTTGAAIPESVVKAQTDVDADKEVVDAAKQVLDARQQLYKDGALARRQVEEAQVNYAQANSAYLSAQEHLRALQSVAKDEQLKTAAAQVSAATAHQQNLDVQLSYSKIYSPIDGVIADRPLWTGEMASPTTPFLTVMDVTRHHHPDRYRGEVGGQSHRGEPRHRSQQHHGPSLGPGDESRRAPEARRQRPCWSGHRGSRQRDGRAFDGYSSGGGRRHGGSSGFLGFRRASPQGGCGNPRGR